MSMVTVRRATIHDLSSVAPLFDGYRIFYGQPSDLAGATGFLRERFERAESAIFVAEQLRSAVGFAQLYPAFSSVRMRRLYLLNDLFVHERARGLRAGERLLAAAAEHARIEGCVRLVLTTAVANLKAQTLYERTGWVRNTQELTYELAL